MSKYSKFCIIILIFYPNITLATNYYDFSNIQSSSTKITWKDKINQNVVKQNKDYSCGLSSLATILTYFYNTPTTEQQLLDDVSEYKKDDEIMASFKDLVVISEKYGFVGQGAFTNYEQLQKFKIPVIVYLNHNRTDHFSVVRAIDKNNVYLADSSLGNRVLTRQKFEKMWYTAKDSKLKGKILFITPNSSKRNIVVNKDFMKIIPTVYN